MEKPVHSANFKKDYIAYSAIVIFFLIISFELFMAIFIPAHLQMEGVWSEEVARQEMINNFDYTRNGFLHFNSKEEYAEGEAKIIADSLTPLAEYLRQYQYQISFKEIKEIEKTMTGIPKFLNHLRKKGAYSTDTKLKAEKFIETLKKEMAKTN
ncbi:MAG: hypothetical protein KAS17_11915 [Victivallaceae bacterium]|nr:hypothetical protein [Victivallaceae bacterium]